MVKSVNVKVVADVKVARKVIEEVVSLRAKVKALTTEVAKANSTSLRLSRENRKLKEAAQAKNARTPATPSPKSRATSTKAGSATAAKAPRARKAP